jgi:two-component system cell cycle response regulator
MGGELVSAFVAWRRGARAGWALLASGAGLLAVALAPDAAPVTLALASSGFAAFRAHRWAKGGRRRQALPDTDLALAGVFAWAALRTAFPGLAGELEIPRLALLVLAGASLEPRAVGALAAATVAMRLVLGASIPGVLADVALLGVPSAIVRREIARTRRFARAHAEQFMTRMRDEARSYRLLAPTSSVSAEARDDDRLAQASVEEIHESARFALSLLRESLDAHTAVLLWVHQKHLRISELVTFAHCVQDAPIPLGNGVLGALVARPQPSRFQAKRGALAVPYYTEDPGVRALLAVPVMDGAELVGILAIDRLDDRPFDEEAEALACLAARFCHRAIRNERLFVQLEKARVEQGKLYRAVQALSAALDEAGVVEAGIAAAHEMAGLDFAIITRTSEDGAPLHTVRAVRCAEGIDLAHLDALSFAPNSGLVSSAVKMRVSLPYRGEFDNATHIVLTKEHALPAVPSLVVLPLVSGEQTLGTLVLGARRRGAFGESVRALLEVLASHLAVSLANAGMVKQLEQLATTDGLTGLYNKRTMLELGAQKIEAAQRFGHPLSVLVTDIDFFKKVNDTYGHDVGDEVIKGLGRILKETKRATDVVARFGGEEFVVLCDQTDAQGAHLLAERVREVLASTVFPSSNGPLSVTASIGVASWPQGDGTWEALFKAADEALYESKRGGRNRTTMAASTRPSPREIHAPPKSSQFPPPSAVLRTAPLPSSGRIPSLPRIKAV